MYSPKALEAAGDFEALFMRPRPIYGYICGLTLKSSLTCIPYSTLTSCASADIYPTVGRVLAWVSRPIRCYRRPLQSSPTYDLLKFIQRRSNGLRRTPHATIALC